MVPISVHYPKPDERVSSFKPFLDNLRLTRIHSMLVGRRLLPLPHKKLVGTREPASICRCCAIRARCCRMLLQENATPDGLALSAAVGVFLAVLPLLFVHSLVILYVSLRLNLNKIVALNVQHLAMPPFVPALCIEVGYYLRHGRLADGSFLCHGVRAVLVAPLRMVPGLADHCARSLRVLIGRHVSTLPHW